MKLQLRQKSKREQALDAFASVAKTWSEWHLGKKVAKTATKGAQQAAKVKGSGKGTRLKIAGAVAVVGGVVAAVAKKLKGGQAEPLYTPPGPAADMEPPPPSPVVVEDLTDDAPERPATETGTGTPPAPPPAPEYVPDTPVVVEDLADEPRAQAPSSDPPQYVADVPVVVGDLADDASDDPPAEAPPPAGAGVATEDLVEPEDLISDSASGPDADDEPVTPTDADIETAPDPAPDSDGDGDDDDRPAAT